MKIEQICEWQRCRQRLSESKEVIRFIAQQRMNAPKKVANQENANNSCDLTFSLRKCLFAHSVCANFGLNAHSVCANFGLNAHSPSYFITLLK